MLSRPGDLDERDSCSTASLLIEPQTGDVLRREIFACSLRDIGKGERGGIWGGCEQAIEEMGQITRDLPRTLRSDIPGCSHRPGLRTV